MMYFSDRYMFSLSGDTKIIEIVRFIIGERALNELFDAMFTVTNPVIGCYQLPVQ